MHEIAAPSRKKREKRLFFMFLSKLNEKVNGTCGWHGDDSQIGGNNRFRATPIDDIIQLNYFFAKPIKTSSDRSINRNVCSIRSSFL